MKKNKMKIRIYDIIWALEDEMVDLPSEVIVSILGGLDGVEDTDEFLSDYLSDEYGYCHLGFKYEIMK